MPEVELLRIGPRRDLVRVFRALLALCLGALALAFLYSAIALLTALPPGMERSAIGLVGSGLGLGFGGLLFGVLDQAMPTVKATSEGLYARAFVPWKEVQQVAIDHEEFVEVRKNGARTRMPVRWLDLPLTEVAQVEARLEKERLARGGD